MKNHLKFWDRIAKSYSKQPIADEKSYQHKLDSIRGYLESHHKVFEFGCGTGGTALALSSSANSVLATDISGKMLAFAEQKRAKADASNVRFQQMNIEVDAIGQNSNDAVLGMSIIHLLEDRESVIRHVWEGLKPGGYFFSSTVCLGASNVFLKYILPIARAFGLLPDVHFIDETQLTSELEAAGFVIDYRFRPRPDAAVFLVARKVG